MVSSQHYSPWSNPLSAMSSCHPSVFKTSRYVRPGYAGDEDKVRLPVRPIVANLVFRPASLRLDLGLFDQVDPLLRVGLDEVGELLGRIRRRRLVAGRLQALAQVGAVEPAPDRGVELGRD